MQRERARHAGGQVKAQARGSTEINRNGLI